MSYKYTKLSELISELQKVLDTSGDMPVCACGDEGWVATVWPDVQPYYYDGSYYIQDGVGPNGKANFVKGRDLYSKDNSIGSSVMKLKCYYMEDDTNFNGRPIREINPGEWTWLDEFEQEQRAKFGGETPKFRGLKYFNKEMGCYPVEAFLENGLFAEGRNIKEAEDNLAKKFLMQDPNILMKEKL